MTSDIYAPLILLGICVLFIVGIPYGAYRTERAPIKAHLDRIRTQLVNDRAAVQTMLDSIPDTLLFQAEEALILAQQWSPGACHPSILYPRTLPLSVIPHHYETENVGWWPLTPVSQAYTLLQKTRPQVGNDLRKSSQEVRDILKVPNVSPLEIIPALQEHARTCWWARGQLQTYLSNLDALLLLKF